MEAELIAAERLILFSDAVAAIAITLLALALRVPAVGRDAVNGQLLTALRVPAAPPGPADEAR